MKDEIKKSENNILKALKSLLEDPLRNHSNDLSAEKTPAGENTISVQPASIGLDLDEENINPNESLIGAQPSFRDRSCLLFPPTDLIPPTSLWICEKKGRNLSTHTRVNFSHSETSSLLCGGRIKF